MNILLWNIRGLVTSKRRIVQDTIKLYNCDIILLQESKLASPSMGAIGGSIITQRHYLQGFEWYAYWLER